MKDLLYYKDLYRPLQGDSAKSTTMTNDEWKRFHHVSTKSSVYSIWKKLESLYKRKTYGNKTFSIRKHVNLKYKEDASIVEYLNKI